MPKQKKRKKPQPVVLHIDIDKFKEFCLRENARRIEALEGMLANTDSMPPWMNVGDKGGVIEIVKSALELGKKDRQRMLEDLTPEERVKYTTPTQEG